MLPCYKTDSIAGIYMFINLLNGKRYIGQSRNVYNRFFRHKEHTETMVFHLALAKYGWEAFSWEFLERMPGATVDEMNRREQHWILHYRTNEKDHGYNRILPLDCPVKRDIARTNIAKANTEGRANAFKGRTHDNFTRQLFSDARRGRKWSSEEKHAIAARQMGTDNHFYGKHHTRECIERANHARVLNEFFNPRRKHNAVYVKLCSETRPAQLFLIDQCSKHLHVDRKTIRKRIAAAQPIGPYSVSYATPEEIAAMLEQRRLVNMASIYGTPTFW